MRQPALPPLDARTLAEAEAVAWSRRLTQADPSESDMADFTDWLLASSHHSDAWDRLQVLEGMLTWMADDLSGHPDQ